ncbi:MAG: glycosyltransferase [Fischerella sp.]|uniref:glycosyltransferase n=1 Tax=Fischerella sp. TaxID=1191 RepID=UPI0017F7D4D9|nr:glycosyltransferase [Fischerella sp.]NWF58338.1 glycosyltransferase [Fischerella sp.]
MNYLLVSYVPFGKGSSPNTYVLGDMWLEDLRAQAEAWSPYGRLGVAVRYVDDLTVADSGSFNLVEINPQEEGFDVFPLPNYYSLKTFITKLPKLRKQLNQACQWASIVQADYNGHPVSLAEIVWPIAKKHNKKRIYVFNGADPFPRLEQFVAQEPNPIIRMLKQQKMVKYFDRFCRQAIREADLVFAHNFSVVERFQQEWSDRCHNFERTFVTDEILISDQQAALRQQRLMDASQPLRLITAGRQTPIKATDHVLRAMAIALSRGIDLHLDVVGDGDSLENYKQLAVELGLEETVRFVGGVPYGRELFDWFDQAHIIVVTNLTAEISRNIFLGMARGLPVILYRNPGSDALLEKHKTSILVPSGDIDALSAAFIEAHQNRTYLAELLANGLALARTRTLDETHRRRAELAACLHG